MKAAQIRKAFLDYFHAKNHTIVESSSLVPHNDPTLLFTNAGMVQFKDVFLGKDPRPYKRATTSQKCVRAGGKHNDLENVGFTARHHTFFEMLGNFSFGDYFKKDAIHYAWEFVTQVLKLPKDRLYVTVFEKDDEAAEIWEKQEGVPKDRIYRFGEKDNFWSMGETGPCGPCTEIFIDRGQKYSCGKPTCKMGCDCDRFMEFWNLVFMQFDRSADGTLTPLPKPSVDTGAGLERIASILQDVDTNYDTDIFKEIIQRVSELAGVAYNPKNELAFSFRVIADHARATAFLIGDGVLPSNEGRGYVLRRIMRRAIRHGRKLGFSGPFFYKAAGFVIDQMQEAYPDLVKQRTLIEKAVQAEEDQFFRTLERGLSLLEEEMAKLKKGQSLAGEIAFKLYDTYGFPLDLTRVICQEKGFGVDEPGFEKSMEHQRSESRKHWKGSGEEALSAVYLQTASRLRDAGKLPEFVGYEKTEIEAPCIWILHQGQEVQSIQAPAEIEACFARTPFYGESGGQTGDRGTVSGAGLSGEVLDVQKPAPDLIVAKIRLTQGALKIGQVVSQHVARDLRMATARNHTATHLLHWALRQTLGTHVKQAGSLVTPDLLRFDFTHFQALHADEIRSIEDAINTKIWAAHAVQKRVMGKDQAIQAGAIAMFGEKYGDQVRVVSVGDFSTELCGGTHVDNAAEIHLFKVGTESGIAAGVRRIIAYTAQGAFEHLRTKEREVTEVQELLKASASAEIPAKIERLHQEARDLRKQVEQLQAQSASLEVSELLARVQTLGSASVLVAEAKPDSTGIKRLRDLADALKQKNPELWIFLAMKDPAGDKASLLAASSPKAKTAVHAAQWIQATANHIGGKGGGKPDQAQAGGTQPAGVPAALAAALEFARSAAQA